MKLNVLSLFLASVTSSWSIGFGVERIDWLGLSSLWSVSSNSVHKFNLSLYLTWHECSNSSDAGLFFSTVSSSFLLSIWTFLFLQFLISINADLTAGFDIGFIIFGSFSADFLISDNLLTGFFLDVYFRVSSEFLHSKIFFNELTRFLLIE